MRWIALLLLLPLIVSCYGHSDMETLKIFGLIQSFTLNIERFAIFSRQMSLKTQKMILA